MARILHLYVAVLLRSGVMLVTGIIAG